ncbi:MAG TPA: HepT-like ribonuclease domain-containing protein [Xanthobacteraceae bacterium]|jgi:uncharacterized protein with HEPN domain
MLENIDAVAEMIAGIDLTEYGGNLMLRRAVERCVEIVSEASRGIPDEMKAASPNQPWPEIASIGNLLRHHCERMDGLIMRKIATRSLPDLRNVVAAMIDQSDRS